MDTATHARTAVVAELLSALDAYAQWLSALRERSGFAAGSLSTGQDELQKVLELRRTSCPLLTREATELLVVHTQLANLLYECQLRTVRGCTTANAGELSQCADLVQRQVAAIELLRRAVARESSEH